MASPTSPKLPPEVIFRILHHFANDCRDWDVLRQHLHLRLVSSWFGSYFEGAVLRDLRLYIRLSPSSTSKHLLKLLQANAHLAAQVKHLFTDDVCAYEGCLDAISTPEEGTGGPPQLAGLEQFRQAASQAQEILLSLTTICLNLESIHVSNVLGSRHQQPYSLFSGIMSHLQMITLSNGAASNCFQGTMQSLSCGTSLVLIPEFREAETSDILSLRLALEADHPPVMFHTLYIVQAPYAFLWSFLAQPALKPRTLFLQVSSYDGLRELVDVLIAAPMLANLEAFYLQLRPAAAASIEQAISRVDVVMELRRLEAASSAGLQARVK